MYKLFLEGTNLIWSKTAILVKVFNGVRASRSLVLHGYVCFVDRCLSFCPFSFRHCVLSFFDVRILITPFSIFKLFLIAYLLYSVDSQNSSEYTLRSSRRLTSNVWTDFIQELLKENEKKLVRFYNFTFRCIVDVRLLNNSMFDVDRIYPMDIGIKIPHPTYWESVEN